MKSISDHLVLSLVLIQIKHCLSETQEEIREKYCGVKPQNFPSVLYPWYVALRLTLNSEKSYYSGTLISNGYVVTAASIFDTSWYPPNWAALPGAYNIPDIAVHSPFGHYFTADWGGVLRIEIHPSYKVQSNDR